MGEGVRAKKQGDVDVRDKKEKNKSKPRASCKREERQDRKISSNGF